MARAYPPAAVSSATAEIIPFPVLQQSRMTPVIRPEKGMRLDHVTERDGTHTVTMTFTGLNEADVVRFSAWISAVMDEAAAIVED